MISGLQLHDNGETVGCRQATGNVAFREAEEFALAFEGDSVSAKYSCPPEARLVTVRLA